MKNFNFEFHAEELRLLGVFVKFCCSRDRQDFIKFSPEFWEPHLLKFNEKLLEISILIMQNQTYRQLNEINARNGMVSPIFTQYLNQLNVILTFANLKVLIEKTESVFEDFDHHNQKIDSDYLVSGLQQLKQAISPYIKQLENAGFDHELQAQLDAYISILNAEYVEKKSLLTELAGWEESNAGLFNDFWATVEEILRTGQKMYHQNSVKLNDYNKEAILNMVNESVIH